MKSPLQPASLVIIALTLAACSSSQDLRYLDSKAVEKLEIPPDLTVAAEVDGHKLPANFSADSENFNALKKIPVLLKVDSMRLQGRADFYWLAVDEPVDSLYQLVKNFWSAQGFQIEIDEPAIGLLQTEWVFNKEGAAQKDASWLERLFTSGNLAATQNQFRTRIERDVETGVSRIYIAHRGTAYGHVLKTGKKQPASSNEWRLVPPNSELEVEMLSRLMLYLGLQQAQLDQQLAKVKLFAPLSSIHVDYSNNETYLLVNDSYSKTWHRTLHQLDRMNIEVVSSAFDNGLLQTQGIIRVKTNVEQAVKQGGFFSFGSETRIEKKQIVLVITKQSDNLTRISIQTPDGEIDRSNEGVEFLTLLHQFLT